MGLYRHRPIACDAEEEKARITGYNSDRCEPGWDSDKEGFGGVRPGMEDASLAPPILSAAHSADASSIHG